MSVCKSTLFSVSSCPRLERSTLSDIGKFLWYQLFVSTLYDVANTDSVAFHFSATNSFNVALKCWMASETCLLSIEDTSATCWISGCCSHRLFGYPRVVCLRITIVAAPWVYLPSRKSSPSTYRHSHCEQHQRSESCRLTF